MKYSFKNLDSYLDALIGNAGYAMMTRFSQYLATFILVVLVGMCTVHFVVNKPVWQINLVRADVQRIENALQRLDADCRITHMQTGVHSLRGLLQHEYDAGLLCGITLQKADNWQGPYLADMPELQDCPYALLKTNKRLFIVPGDGVVLPNGMQIGKDLKWHATTNVQALSRSGGPLFYQSGSFTRQLHLPRYATRKATDPLPTAARQWSNWFAEFGDAMTFAQASAPALVA